MPNRFMIPSLLLLAIRKKESHVMNEPMIQDTSRKDVPRPARRRATAMPRWVLVTLVLLLLGVLVFAIMHFTGGHSMGGMHMSIPEAGRSLL